MSRGSRAGRANAGDSGRGAVETGADKPAVAGDAPRNSARGVSRPVDAAACLQASRRCEVAALRHLMLAGGLVLAVNALVHALQRERGSSSLWLARSGGRAEQWLVEHRHAVDVARDALDQRLAERLEIQSCGARLYARLALALEHLDAMVGLRDQIDARALTVEQAVGAFTRLIHALLDVVFEAADAATDPPVARALVALFHFVQGKEQAGQERAIGAAVFGRGSVSLGERDALLQRIEWQDRCFQVFSDFAEPSVQAQWEAFLDQPFVARVEHLRRRLLTGGPEPDEWRPDVAETWFARATERIDAMKMIEDALEAALESICSKRLAEVESEQAALDLRRRHSAESTAANASPTSQRVVAPSAFLESPIRWPDMDDVHLPLPSLPVDIGTDAGRSILDVLHEQSRELREIRKELTDARRALEERKLLQRAKALLMKHRNLTEDQAHQLLRRTAMAQNRRLADVAAATIDLAEVLAEPDASLTGADQTPPRRPA
ncbi:MAG: nitrate- and nitrite sensing domain-containing protein [Thioalkalivibrionaceae bacterium]